MKLKKIMLSLLAFSSVVALGACSNNNSGNIEYVEGDSNGDSGTNLDRNNGKTDGENSSSSTVDTNKDTTGYVSIKNGLSMLDTTKDAYYGSADKTQEQLYIDVVNKCNDSVVDLFITSDTSQGQGSGVLFGWDDTLGLSYIMTCFHMIDSITSCKVVDVYGSEYQAKLVGGYKDQDLAIIAIKTPTDHTLTYASLLDEDSKLYTGQTAIAIGNNDGYSHTVSDGIISYANRAWTTSLYDYKTINQIQISTEINGGNSGGGLFSTTGALIGITNAGVETSTSGASVEGVKFAVSYTEMWKVIENFYETAKYNSDKFDFIEGYVVGDYEFSFDVTAKDYIVSDSTGRSYRTYNAITSIDYSNDTYSDYDLLKLNDLITAYEIDYSDENKTDVGKTSVVNQDTSVLLTALNSSNLTVGDTVILTIIRGRSEITVSITLSQYRYVSTF